MLVISLDDGSGLRIVNKWDEMKPIIFTVKNAQKVGGLGNWFAREVCEFLIFDA
jgi:hypothetical protein